MAAQTAILSFGPLVSVDGHQHLLTGGRRVGVGLGVGGGKGLVRVVVVAD
jgi:hypothetical protein